MSIDYEMREKLDSKVTFAAKLIDAGRYAEFEAMALVIFLTFLIKISSIFNVTP